MHPRAFIMSSPRPRLSQFSTAFTLGLLLVASSCTSNSDDPGGGTPPGSGGQTIAELLEPNGLTTLKSALEAAGLLDDLDGAGPFTLFAPTNAAIDALGTATLDHLLDPANVAELIDLLEYHIVAADLDDAAIRAVPTVPGQNGDDVLVDSLGPFLYLNNAVIVDADIDASNGTLHIIDAVLRPPLPLLETLEQRGLTILADAVQRAGLQGALTGADVTFFAPTDDAFNALDPAHLAFLLDPANVAELEALLTYHVTPSLLKATEAFFAAELPSMHTALQFYGLHEWIPTINRAPISALNLPATDGIVQEIDEVLDIPVDLVATLEARGYSILVTMLEAAELDDDLRATGPFTIFAPTNGALNALPPGVLDLLLDPANQAELIEWLEYHVLGDVHQAREVRTLPTLTTLQGELIAIDPLNGYLLLNGSAEVTRPDTYASNGVIHGIIEVLSVPAP